jgi:hypothetical protein
MNHRTRAFRNLILSATTLSMVMLVWQAVQAQCVSSELKEKWGSGRYQEVVVPLMACFDRVRSRAETLELEYMLAKTWCNLRLHKQDGCDMYATLKSENGSSININGRRINLRRDACCVLTEEVARESGIAGIGVSTSQITQPKPFGDIVKQARTKMDTAGYSQILSKASGRCLDIYTGSQDNAALLIQYDCHAQDNQSWKLIRRDDGYFNIVAKHSRKCLDVNGSSAENGIEIFQYDCHDGDNQRWRIERTEDGYYTITAKHSRKCLDVSGSSQENLTHIVQWDCHGGDNQKWIIRSGHAGRRVMVAPPPPGRVVVPPPPERRPQH